jgi:hypothetical protein
MQEVWRDQILRCPVSVLRLPFALRTSIDPVRFELVGLLAATPPVLHPYANAQESPPRSNWSERLSGWVRMLSSNSSLKKSGLTSWYMGLTSSPPRRTWPDLWSWMRIVSRRWRRLLPVARG